MCENLLVLTYSIAGWIISDMLFLDMDIWKW